MIYIVLGLLGLCFGSFANALVWRVHEQEASKKENKKLSIINGRSMCIDCKHELSALDLIPVLGWVLLRGRCRYCHKIISWQYPFVEIMTLAIFLISFVFWPFGFEPIGMARFVFWLIFVVGFMALTVYDMRWMILPNRILVPLFWLAIVQVVAVSLIDRSAEQLISSFFGVLIASGMFYVLFQISNGRWIGGGDVKLGAVLGLIIGGPIASFLMLFVGSLVGSVFSIPVLASGKGRKAKVPFGPFLILGTLVVYIFGTSIINWYEKTFLLL